MAFLYCWGIFIVSHVLELGSGASKYRVDPKSMKIIGSCCLFSKGIMTDSLVIIHNQEKVKAVLRKGSKKQVQNWLPLEHPRVKALIWAILSFKVKIFLPLPYHDRV